MFSAISSAYKKKSVHQTHRIVVLSILSLAFMACSTTSQHLKEEGRKNDTRLYPNAVDFSHAGVNYSESAIPTSNLPIFSVSDYGAIPNDDVEDRDAIQQTIDAAEKNNGGIVYFPPGKYLVNEQENRRFGLRISSSKIVLRGSGLGNGENGLSTQLFMKYPLAPQDPNKLWTVPSMITFLPKGETHPTSNIKKRDYVFKTLVTANAKFGDLAIVVSDTSELNAGDVITLEMENVEANKEFLQGKTPRDIWKRINTQGVMVSESHEILKVSGKRITLKKPLLTNINSQYGWAVGKTNMIKNVGIENLHFIGNFKEEFEHHKNAIHDSGYSAIKLSKTRHSWAKNLRFSDISGAVTITGGIANSILLNVIDGNRGHNTFNVTFGTRNLVGLNLDVTNKGQWHGPSVSHLSVGTVVWHFNSPTSRGLDTHSVYPRHTLFDQIESYGFGGWGGNYTTLPNHLGGLVVWNFTQTGEKVGEWFDGTLDFWKIPTQVENRYGFLTAVNPIIVGYKGNIEKVNENNVEYVDSLGELVQPPSLYEAQLEKRLGTRPTWIGQLLNEWETFKAYYLP